MNIATSVGLFCLIFCLHLQVNGQETVVVRRGTVEIADHCDQWAKGLEGACYGFTCDKLSGNYTIARCVETARCANGDLAVLNLSLRLPFPACCNTFHCQDGSTLIYKHRG